MNQVQTGTAMAAQKTAGIITVVALLVGLAIGAGGGYKYGYKKGQAAYKKQITQTLGGPIEIKSFSGKITAISGSQLTLEAQISSGTPLLPSETKTMTVTVTDTTKFTKQTSKTTAELTAEQKAFDKALKEGKTPVPPMPFKSVVIKLSDLKAGDTISVTSDSDVTDKTQITAVEIILSSIQAPQAPIK